MVQSDSNVTKSAAVDSNSNVGQIDLFNELDLLNTNQATNTQ